MIKISVTLEVGWCSECQALGWNYRPLFFHYRGLHDESLEIRATEEITAESKDGSFDSVRRAVLLAKDPSNFAKLFRGK